MVTTSRRWLAAAGVLAGSVALALAQGPGRRGMVPWDGFGMKERLGLTDEQAEQLRSHRLEAARERVKIRSEMKIARIELRELMASPAPDEKAVMAKARQIGDLHTRLLETRLAHGLALKKILSPEQQQRLREMRAAGRGPGPREGLPGRRVLPGRRPCAWADEPGPDDEPLEDGGEDL